MQTVSVKLRELKQAYYNPENRICRKRVRNLQKSISDVGLVNPILITKNKEVVDGHRRIAACRSLGWSSITAFVTTVDIAKAYAAINTTQQKMSGNDSLGVWLKNRDAVSQRACKTFDTMESILGRTRMQRMYSAGLSASSYTTAVRMAHLCDRNPDNLVPSIIDWFLKFEQIGPVVRAMQAGQSLKPVLDAIKKKKPIKMNLSVAC